jgi:diguanylate cyclase (GGDEF)-like protein
MDKDDNHNQFTRPLLHAIQEASPDGILVVDRHSQVISYNQRFLEVWQIEEKYRPSEQVVRQHLPEEPLLDVALRKLKDPDAFLQRIQELYDNPELHDHTEIELTDGRTLDRHSTGLFDDQNNYLGRVWFFRDITRQKLNESLLQDLAWRDPLTGIMTRGYFLERAEKELLRTQRYGHTLAVIMLDVDHFKQVNDRYGHGASDQVLKTLCQRWLDTLRNSDLLGRIGGEEFAILLPQNDLEAALQSAERIRSITASQPVHSDGIDINCTVSCGVTLLDNNQNDSIQDALKRADNALYNAKKRGRNRVEHFRGVL